MHLRSTLSVKELFEEGFISRNAYTVCARAQLLNLADICQYQIRYIDFLNIKNCGRKINEELVAVCHQCVPGLINKAKPVLPDTISPESITSLSLANEQPPEPTPFGKWNAKTEEDQLTIEYEYEILKRKLSRRAKNRLLTLCKGNPTAAALLTILSGGHVAALQQMLRPDTMSGAELINLTTALTDIFIATDSSKHNNSGQVTMLLLRMSKLVPCHSTSEMALFIKLHWDTLPAGNFPLLSFAHLFFQHCSGVRANHKKAFLQYTDWYAANTSTSLAVAAAQSGYTENSLKSLLSKEKIDVQLLHLLGEAIGILQSFKLCIPSSFILKNQDYQPLTPAKVTAQTPFTNQFVLRLITMLNPSQVAIKVQGAKGKQWFFISKFVSERFNIVSFFDTVYKLVKVKTSRERMLPLAGLLLPYYKGIVLEKERDDLYKIISSLMYDLYDLRPNEDGCLHLERNMAKGVWEYVYEILKEQNKPCHAGEIVSLLAQKGIEEKPSDIWSRLKYSGIFMISGNSTYALQEWEEDGREVGGTIKQLAVKFLTQCNEPKHIHDIANWIMKYRCTSQNSIRNNLQIDPLHKFRYFGNGFYGLSGTEYKSIPVNLVDVRWLRYVKRLFAKAKTDRMERSLIVESVCLFYNLQPEHVECLIDEQIDAGIFQLQDEYLVLVSAALPSLAKARHIQ